MRDELVEALTPGRPPTRASRWVELRARAGPSARVVTSTSSAPVLDPATAHLIRLERSVGRALARLNKATVSYLHGASVGSGIELAAFTDTVVAARDTTIAPARDRARPGARRRGQTPSLPRRIGRLRTAWLVFSGSTIDAATALGWGLVDEVVD